MFIPRDNIVELRKLNTTITVKLTKEFTFRMWLGINLIKVAAIVLGCSIMIDRKRGTR